MAVAPIFSAAGVSRSLLREAMTTSAPSCLASAAVARPMPDEPPTTTTFCPASNIVFLWSLKLCTVLWSRRLKLHADARLAAAEARQLPDAGAGGIDVGCDVDIDQIGLVGRDALADRLANIAGAIDAHTLDAAGGPHCRELRIEGMARPRIVEVSR